MMRKKNSEYKDHMKIPGLNFCSDRKEDLKHTTLLTGRAELGRTRVCSSGGREDGVEGNRDTETLHKRKLT